jgi:hypothetical protein
MKRVFFLAVVMSIVFSLPDFSLEQTTEATHRILLIRKARVGRQGAVAVEVYLIGDVLEVKVIGKLYDTRTKPSIEEIRVAGPRLGKRLSPQERRTLHPTVEDDKAFYKAEDIKGGIIRIIEGKKVKGRKESELTNELIRFKIPTGRILPGRNYQLWVELQNKETEKKPETFRFGLKNFSTLISEFEDE